MGGQVGGSAGMGCPWTQGRMPALIELIGSNLAQLETRVQVIYCNYCNCLNQLKKNPKLPLESW